MDYVTITIAGDAADFAVPLMNNGTEYKFERNTEYQVPQAVADILQDSGFDVTVSHIEGPGDASVDLGADAGVGNFSADAVIEGNVEAVVGRLSTLTAEQLALVEAAENDREKARTSVLAAIAAARAKLA